MYSQSKGRHFNVGQHEELLSYLLSICPLHPGEDWEEDKKLNLILSKVQEHQQSLRDPGSGGKSISLILDYIGTHYLYVKFVLSKKATKFDKIFTVDLTLTTHRSLVDYLPQVKKAKNCPTSPECVLS